MGRSSSVTEKGTRYASWASLWTSASASAEAALRRSEAKFRAVVENSHDGISFCDQDARITYRSPSFANINGYTDAERVGQGAFDPAHPDDRDVLRRYHDQLLQFPGSPLTTEYRIRHRDGTWRWLETMSLNLLSNPDIAAIVSTSRDITARKAAESQTQAALRSLSESEDRFRALIEQAPVAIAISRKGINTYVNPACLRMFGYERAGELAGCAILDLIAPRFARHGGRADAAPRGAAARANRV